MTDSLPMSSQDGWRLFLDDENRQNNQAANAGDGPKHIAWLHLFDLMKDRLRCVVETHAGGGLYRVERGRFCVDLPADCILGRHQRCALEPVMRATDNQVYYSGSADQSLINLTDGCKYVAYETRNDTRERLKEVAKLRKREGRAEFAESYAGNGEPATGVGRRLESCQPESTLIMIDPFTITDLCRAAGSVVRQSGGHKVCFPTVIFGVHGYEGRGRREFYDGWLEVSDYFESMRRIEWWWTGASAPGKNITHWFRLLIAVQEQCELEEMARRLKCEHDILVRCRETSHAYSAEKPPAVLS